jgi:hypothetical protein
VVSSLLGDRETRGPPRLWVPENARTARKLPFVRGRRPGMIRRRRCGWSTRCSPSSCAGSSSGRDPTPPTRSTSRSCATSSPDSNDASRSADASGSRRSGTSPRSAPDSRRRAAPGAHSRPPGRPARPSGVRPARGARRRGVHVLTFGVVRVVTVALSGLGARSARITRSTSTRQDRQEQEWGAWFAAVEPRLVDPGNPRRRTHDDQPHRTDFMRRPFDPSIAHHH